MATSLARKDWNFQALERTRTYNRITMFGRVFPRVITINGVNYTVRSRVIPNAEIPNTNIGKFGYYSNRGNSNVEYRNNENCGTRAISLVSYL